MPDGQDIKTAGRMDSIRIWLLFASAMIGVFIAGYNAFDDLSDEIRDQREKIEKCEELTPRVIRLEILMGADVMAQRIHYSKIKQVQRENNW